MKINKELFRKVAQRIEDDPEHYDQNAWIDTTADCGTTYCIAGWAASLSGCVFNDVLPGEVKMPDSGDVVHVQSAALHFLIGSKLEGPLTQEEHEFTNMFRGQFLPPEGMTVPEVLRAIADGKPVSEFVQ